MALVDEGRAGVKICEFPQFFPQVWKTLGTGQRNIGRVRPEMREIAKDADSNTVRWCRG
jgi:hypothetical protein